MEAREKEAQVAAWLKKIFGDHPIPQYEVNSRTTEILHHLSERNRTRDRDMSLVIEDLRQKAGEYEAEAKQLQDFLMESVSLSPANLSSTGSKFLSALVDSAVALETKDTSLASDLKKAELHLSRERAKVDSRLQNMGFLQAKSGELRLAIKAAEEQLPSRGMDASLSHQSLVALSEKLADLKEQTIPLKKKLESYLDLMPNPSLAQVKIEEAKRELDFIEAELTKKIDMMEL
ncbi:HAUS augmin-like complex subunit 1 isoform X3 [Erinaceus europaeus]|uniref:HAUS augmin-like complex subunit 1 isoform X3 n=1 Tax=Erinaceus europaeus TaxID=9365 RepID=A0ABM3VZY2_ERIEU|nr:HAUS augmin-like complex subunit 1 isoform X3 [Erinaceus europaeus]